MPEGLQKRIMKNSDTAGLILNEKVVESDMLERERGGGGGGGESVCHCVCVCV